MFFHKRFLTVIAAIMTLFIASACGSTATTTGSSSTSTQSTPTAAPTIAPTATATSATTSSAVVKTATATVNGTSETILTDSQGMTLYYFTPDTATKATCTGNCTSIWPPLLYTGSGSPMSATTLTGTLSAVSSTNGKQVLYNGHFLYTYASDTAPGDTKGQGVAGQWFVATPTLRAAKATAGY